MSWVDAGRGRKIQTGKATVLTWSKEREGSADMPLLSFRTLACLIFEASKGCVEAFAAGCGVRAKH